MRTSLHRSFPRRQSRTFLRLATLCPVPDCCQELDPELSSHVRRIGGDKANRPAELSLSGEVDRSCPKLSAFSSSSSGRLIIRWFPVRVQAGPLLRAVQADY